MAYTYINTVGFLRPGQPSSPVTWEDPIIRPFQSLVPKEFTSATVALFPFLVSIDTTYTPSGHTGEFKLRVSYETSINAGFTVKFFAYDLASDRVIAPASPVWTMDTPGTGATSLYPLSEANEGALAVADAAYKESGDLHSGAYCYIVTGNPGTAAFSISAQHTA